MAANIEPGCTEGQFGYLRSIATSLKRIADMMERKQIDIKSDHKVEFSG